MAADAATPVEDKRTPLSLKIGLLVLVGLALALRIGSIAGEAIDGDELYTLEFATAPLAENVGALLDDGAHPPLHYVLAAGSVRVFGSTPMALRGLSLLVGLVLVVGVTLWIYRLTAAVLPALAGGLLVSVSNEAIYFSQQGRSYALYTLLVFGMLVVLHRAVGEDEHSRSRLWWAFGALVFAALMTHYVAALYVVASGVALLAFGQPLRHLRRWLVAVAPGGVALALWLLAVRRTAERADHGIAESITWRGVPRFSELADLVARLTGQPAVNGGTTVALLVAVALSAWIGWWALGEWRTGATTGRVRFLAVAFLFAALPPALLYLIAQPPIEAPVWGHRHLFPSHVPLVVFFTAGLWWASRQRRGAFVGFMTPLVALTVAALVTAPSPRRIPFQEVAAFLVDGGAGAAAPVLTTEAEMIGRPVQYYLGSDLSVGTWSGAEAPRHFWLLHRESILTSALTDSLLAEGWTVASQRHFGDGSGPTVWEFRRE